MSKYIIHNHAHRIDEADAIERVLIIMKSQKGKISFANEFYDGIKVQHHEKKTCETFYVYE